MSEERNKGWSTILNAVSDWIKLLALVVLVAEAILIAAMTQTPESSPRRDWYPVIIVGLLVLIVIGIFFDRYLQRPSIKKGPNTTPNIESIISSIGTSDDKEIAAALKNVGNGISKALENNNPIFRKVISRKINNFSADVNNWKNGQLYVGPTDSKGYLLELYKNAKESVFSTSVKDFFLQWSENFGDRILEANKESKARVIRMFIYNNRGEVMKEDFEQMT